MPSVREVMSKDLVTVDRSATVEEASTVMWARRVGSALVMLGDELEGIFTERDIMKALSKNADRGRTDLLHRIRPWDEAAKDNAISNAQLLRELDERGLVLAVSEHAKLQVGPVTPEQGERSDRHLHAVALDQRAVRDDESRSCLTVLRVSRRGRDRGRVR